MSRELCRGRVFLLSFENSPICLNLNKILSTENFDIQLNIFRNDSSVNDLLTCEIGTDFNFFVFIEIPLDFESLFKHYLRSKSCHIKIICCHLFPKRIVCDFGANYEHSPVLCRPLTDEVLQSVYRTVDVNEISCDICRVILSNTLHPLLPVNQLYTYEPLGDLKLLVDPVSTSLVVFGCNLLSFNIILCLLDHLINITIVDDDIVHKYDLFDGIYSDGDLLNKKCTVFRQRLTSLNKKCTILECDVNAKAICLNKWISFKQQNAIVLLTSHDNSYKRYVHKMCVYAELPIIDVGSEYLKFHVNVSLPFKTETYFSFNDAPEKVSYPLCTIKSFPTNIEHCVQWALAKWSSITNRKLPVLKSWIDCLKWSRLTFEKHFNHKPRQLLVNIPADTKKENGDLFWSEYKQPNPLLFSIDNQLCFDFLLYFAKLLATASNIMIMNCDKQFITEVMNCTTIPSFVSKEEATNMITHDNRREAMTSTNFVFDNDDHCKLLYTATNLRANIYGIPIISVEDFTKMSLNLVPCSSLAVYTAAVCATKELHKLLIAQDCVKNKNLEISNYYANLAESDIFLICEPLPSKRLMLNSVCFNEWDSWTIYEKNVEDTLDMLLESLKQKSNGLECTMLVMENGDSCKTLFMSILPDSVNRRHKQLRELMDFKQEFDAIFVILIACFDTENEDQCLAPFVKYHFLNSCDASLSCQK